jgi:hypothetical protein
MAEILASAERTRTGSGEENPEEETRSARTSVEQRDGGVEQVARGGGVDSSDAFGGAKEGV